MNITYSDACLAFGRQLVARYGDNPDVMDGLEVQTIACPHLGTTDTGFTIAAWPKGRRVTRENLICAYYGAIPEAMRAAAR